ncbi:TRAP transporter small permease subunit [Nitrincola iocasae]|jgi:TRAP-type mannitol/chloroaromatic compound transport system permease small subunit|uniref:TRAP transporter small permease protein n=1 Tax=Nitrincola iocasae TaxID=2614693 RepID=A0A5J6LC77_9GAMM|nr:TRAP transporter small permease subunit [Nitrincola iocasae]QEW05802.1 TRAP transporter small permease subunit [Nitrincola iocasae]
MAEYNVDLNKVEEAVAHKAAVEYPRTLVSDVLEGTVEFFGKYTSLLWIALMLLIVANVLMRYTLGTNFIALEELQWHLYAVGFMVGLSYCVLHDGHVRVDVLAEHWHPRTRAVVEIIGLVVLFLPFCYFILSYAWPFVERSYRINEVSAAPGGLPMRWLIKSVILLAFTLMAMAAVARLIRAFSFLTGFPRERKPSSK